MTVGIKTRKVPSSDFSRSRSIFLLLRSSNRVEHCTHPANVDGACMLKDEAFGSFPSVLRLVRSSVVVVMSTVREIWRGRDVMGSGGLRVSWNMFNRNLSVGLSK